MATASKLAKVLSRPEWAERLGALLEGKGATGASPAGLKRPKVAAENWELALAELVREGAVVAVEKAGKVKYFARGFAPLSAEEVFRREVLARVNGRTAWLEEALAGKGEKAAPKCKWLEALAREGKLLRLEVATSKSAGRKVAYLLPEATVGPRALEAKALPDWLKMEQAGREMAAARFDHTITFEALADRLGVTPLVVKTAVSQRLELHGGLQLIRGEPREVRDAANAGLTLDGDTYYRFRFTQ